MAAEFQVLRIGEEELCIPVVGWPIAKANAFDFGRFTLIMKAMLMLMMMMMIMMLMMMMMMKLMVIFTGGCQWVWPGVGGSGECRAISRAVIINTPTLL